METPTPQRGSDRRSPASQAVAALLVTGVVVLGLWGGQVPPLPSLPTLAVAVVTGGSLGVALATYDLDPFGTVLGGVFAFLLIVVGGLFVGGMLFPDDLPTAVEVCLLAWAWADVVARVRLRAGDPRPN